MLQSDFFNNSALISGGAIYITGGIEVYIADTKFSTNSAFESGGCMGGADLNKNITLLRSNFSQCYAE